MEVDRMTEDIKDFNITHWNKQLQETIIEGRDNLEIFLNKLGGINKEYNLGFKLIDISEDLLQKLLKKEIFEYDKKSLDFETYLLDKSQGRSEASILFQSIEENDKYNRVTINHYIHALYIQDLKI